MPAKCPLISACPKTPPAVKEPLAELAEIYAVGRVASVSQIKGQRLRRLLFYQTVLQPANSTQFGRIRVDTTTGKGDLAVENHIQFRVVGPPGQIYAREVDASIIV